jgi:SAM-dependent methyltransferase
VQPYDDDYYRANGQSRDRPALSWYTRVARRYLDLSRSCDYGCGTGWLMHHLASHGEVAGVEPSPDARRQAIDRNPDGLVLDSLQAFPDHHFTVMFAVHVVEHLTDAELTSTFSEFRRVLVPGGGLFLVTPDSGGLAHRLMGAQWRALEDPTHVNLKSSQRWLDLIDEAGFDTQCVGTDGLWDWPYRRARRRWVTGPTMVAAQLVSGRLLADPGSGESLVVVARMRPHTSRP